MTKPANVCPNCESRMAVYRVTRPLASHPEIVHRFRECGACGLRTRCRERTETVSLGDAEVIRECTPLD